MNLARVLELTHQQSLDLFTSISAGRPPRYLPLLRLLFGEQGSLWTQADGEVFNSLQIDPVSGCPNEVMVALGEISSLWHWKVEESRNRTLSYRELVRRAEDIERRLRRQDPSSFSAEIQQAPLHSSLAMQMANVDQVIAYPNGMARRIIANVHCEAAILYLNSILSDQNPGEACTFSNTSQR
jgi:hypothetical protein